MTKIALIGGGITGLTAAFYLQKAGFSPLLFEAEKNLGGSIQTRKSNGYLFELGPNSLQETGEAIELIQNLDLADEVIEGNPDAKNRYIVRNGQLLPLPMSPPALLRTPLLSWRGKLRLLKEPFVRSRSSEKESLADFTRRRLGPEILDSIVDPFISGIFAGDPELLSARHGMPRLFEMEKKHGSLFRAMKAAAKQKKDRIRLISFESGLSRLIERLAEKLDRRIYRETKVESIKKTEKGWQLIARRFNRRLRDDFDTILFALPASALAKIEFENEKPFSLNELEKLPHPPVVTISHGFQKSQIDHPLDGFGMLIPKKEGRQILGTIFASTLFPNRAPENRTLLTTFLGGTRQSDLTTSSKETIRKIVLDDLNKLLGIHGKPDFENIEIWPHAIPQYNLGHDSFLQKIEKFETENPGLHLAGPIRDGISIGQCIASGKNRAKELENRQKGSVQNS